MLRYRGDCRCLQQKLRMGCCCRFFLEQMLGVRGFGYQQKVCVRRGCLLLEQMLSGSGRSLRFQMVRICRGGFLLEQVLGIRSGFLLKQMVRVGRGCRGGQ